MAETEKGFQQAVIELAQRLGYRHYHTYRSDRSVKGFPDLVLVKNGRLIFAELKSERGKNTVDQTEWLNDLKECACEVYLWRPKDWPKIERLLRQQKGRAHNP